MGFWSLSLMLLGSEPLMYCATSTPSESQLVCVASKAWPFIMCSRIELDVPTMLDSFTLWSDDTQERPVEVQVSERVSW